MPNTVAFDTYVVDTLMPDLVGHDGQPSAFLVYLFLWSQSRARRSRAVPASYAQIAIGTGLSRSAVQTAVTTLRRRQLVGVQRGSPTAVPEYTVLRPWQRR
jgi:CRP-like cAMP-binding protein